MAATTHPDKAPPVAPLSASRKEGLKKHKMSFTLFAASAGERVVGRSLDRVSLGQRSKPMFI